MTHILRYICILITSNLLSSVALADDVFITADRAIDVKKGKIIGNVAILVHDHRIAQVGKQSEMKAPDGARIINLGDMTLMPGLIDTHTHITSEPVDGDYEPFTRPSAWHAIYGVKNAQKTLMAGITTIRNLGAEQFADVALRDAIKRGVVPGPRMFVSGPALGITGGHCDTNILSADFKYKSQGIADGPWAVRAKVRENIKYGVDLIKFCATGGVFSRGTKVGIQQYTLVEMQAIVDEAHRRGLTVAAHAHGTEGIKSAIIAGVDSIEHASFLDDEAIKLAKKHGTVFSMDIYNTEYTLSMAEENNIRAEYVEKEKQVGTIQRRSFTNAVKAGITVIFGTDAAVYPHGDNAKQLAVMVRFGMTPMQALQAATILPAKLLKQENTLGQLRKGYFADIVAVKGNPLEEISLMENMSFIMKDGIVYKMNE